MFYSNSTIPIKSYIILLNFETLDAPVSHLEVYEKCFVTQESIKYQKKKYIYKITKYNDSLP